VLQKPGKGEKAINRAIELFPDFVGGYAVQARIFVFAKRYNEALESMDKGLSFPHFTDEYRWAGGRSCCFIVFFSNT